MTLFRTLLVSEWIQNSLTHYSQPSVGLSTTMSKLADMKKIYRQAVCYTINGIILLVLSPILLIGMFAEWLCIKFLVPITQWLKTKLRIYDTDPD